RDARTDASNIWVNTAHANAGRGGAVAHVRVEIDQAGHDVAFVAPNLEHARGLCRRNLRLNSRDLSILDRDVHAPVQALARVEDVTTFHHKVVGHLTNLASCRPHSSAARHARTAPRFRTESRTPGRSSAATPPNCAG